MVEPVHSVLLFPFPSPVPNSVSVESSDEALPNRIAAKLERERRGYPCPVHASSCTLSSPSITLLFIRLINKACYPRYALIGWKVDWHGIGDRYFNHVRARTRSCRDGEKERRKDRDKKREERVTIVRGRIHGRERRRKERRKTNSFHEFHRLIPSIVAPRGSL